MEGYKTTVTEALGLKQIRQVITVPHGCTEDGALYVDLWSGTQKVAEQERHLTGNYISMGALNHVTCGI